MSEPAPFETYPCSLGTVLDHGEAGDIYRIQTPSGQVIGIRAATTPSPENVEADIANPPAPPLSPVPSQIGPAQLRVALHRLHDIAPASVDAAIDSVIDAIPDTEARLEARIYADYSTGYLRAHPLVAAIAAALNLSSDQVDEVFRLGATL